MNLTLNRRKTPKGSRPPMRIPQIVHNNTPFSLAEVKSFCRYGGFINIWQHRYVDVYQPPVEFIAEHPEGIVITIETNHVTDQIWIYGQPYSLYKTRIINADWSM
jgi:hypothetical protein